MVKLNIYRNFVDLLYRNKKFICLFIIAILTLVLAGCDKIGLNEKPALSKEDSRQVTTIIKNLYFSYLNNEEKKAVPLFLPSARKTAEKLVIKHTELTSENKESYAVKSVSLVTRQRNRFWPENQSVELNDEELDRLTALENEYQKVVVALINTMDNKQANIFAVKKNNRFYLLL